MKQKLHGFAYFYDESTRYAFKIQKTQNHLKREKKLLCKAFFMFMKCILSTFFITYLYLLVCLIRTRGLASHELDNFFCQPTQLKSRTCRKTVKQKGNFCTKAKW